MPPPPPSQIQCPAFGTVYIKKRTVPKAWHREAEFKKPTVVGVKTPTSPAFTVVAAGMPLLLGLIFNTTHFLNDFLKKNSFQDLAL